MQVRTLLTVFAFLTAATTAALGQDPLVAIRGWGQESCGRWLDVRDARNRNLQGQILEDSLRQWVMGYITAYNTFIASDADVFNDADDAAIMAVVDNACRDNPLLLITAAVATVIRKQQQ